MAIQMVPQRRCVSTYLAHLQLEETALLLHLFCYFSPGDLRADHPVLLGVLSFLLLDLCTNAGGEDGNASDAQHLERYKKKADGANMQQLTHNLAS